jgi:hypothetical protein
MPAHIPSLDALDSYLRRRTHDDTFSGVALITRGGDHLFAGAYGYASHVWKVSNTLVTRIDTQTSIAVVGMLVRVILLAFSEWPNVADVFKVGGTALVAACLSMLLATVSS